MLEIIREQMIKKREQEREKNVIADGSCGMSFHKIRFNWKCKVHVHV